MEEKYRFMISPKEKSLIYFENYFKGLRIEKGHGYIVRENSGNLLAELTLDQAEWIRKDLIDYIEEFCRDFDLEVFGRVSLENRKRLESLLEVRI